MCQCSALLFVVLILLFLKKKKKGEIIFDLTEELKDCSESSLITFIQFFLDVNISHNQGISIKSENLTLL